MSASTPDGRLEPIPQHPVTLRVEDDEVQGTAACNGYGATADHGGQTFRVRDIRFTEMACPGAGVMELEQAYLTGLSAVEDAHLSSGRLVLSGDGVQLEFRAASGEERG